MKATIKLCQSGRHKEHIIVLTDDNEKILEQIAVTEVVLEGVPHVSARLGDGNAVVITAGNT
jgi:hypothetical protein